MFIFAVISSFISVVNAGKRDGGAGKNACCTRQLCPEADGDPSAERTHLWASPALPSDPLVDAQSTSRGPPVGLAPQLQRWGCNDAELSSRGHGRGSET